MKRFKQGTDRIEDTFLQVIWLLCEKQNVVVKTRKDTSYKVVV